MTGLRVERESIYIDDECLAVGAKEVEEYLLAGTLSACVGRMLFAVWVSCVSVIVLCRHRAEQ